jgi:hypothetical protein
MLNKRVEVFQDFMSSEKFKDLSLDGDKQDVLIKVTDNKTVVRGVSAGIKKKKNNFVGRREWDSAVLESLKWEGLRVVFF